MSAIEEPYLAQGESFKMITSLEIKNFKCFESIKIPHIPRFNFIVGESGSGKTSLLEALFLLSAGNPEAYFRLRRWRGFRGRTIELTGERESYESLFRDLFYDFHERETAEIKLQDSNGRDRGLQIYYKGSASTARNPESKVGHAFTINPIVFKWDTDRKIVNCMIELKDGQLKMENSAPVYPGIFIAPNISGADQTASRYSELSKRNKEGQILSTLHSIFPDITSISLELSGGEPMLYVSAAHLSEKLPIAALSGGLNKYLTIVLAILANPKGAILIDEIEDGFYFNNLPTLLRNIIKLCVEHEVQIFSTTHSYEFLQRLGEVIESLPEIESRHFSLMRMERSERQPTLTMIEAENFMAAVGQSFEVR